MSKLSPLLQEVETNKELDVNLQETPEVSVEAPEVEVDKTCPEGSVWDDDKGMCIPEIEEVELDVDDEVEDLSLDVIEGTIVEPEIEVDDEDEDYLPQSNNLQ